jgi:hypothetical protein
MKTKRFIDEVVCSNSNVFDAMPQLYLPDYFPTSNKPTAIMTQAV